MNDTVIDIGDTFDQAAKWRRYLSFDRLLRDGQSWDRGRNPFQQDMDLITFSAAFRRLQDKTQVQPLTENDHVRKRLTHSLEVAAVGRSLGTAVGAVVCEQYDLGVFTPDALGNIVQAACLAHDIGNPPFGHQGEQAIRDWFCRSEIRESLEWLGLTEAQIADFETFEGNAQGFRILTQLENYKFNGGLRLTHAMLGAFAKYPRPASSKPAEKHIWSKKNGIFQSELDYFRHVADKTGLVPVEGQQDSWHRHPLVYLMEAADDICYHIIDVEDGFEVGRISYNDAIEVLVPLAEKEPVPGQSESEAIGYLRGTAIGNLIAQATAAFLENQDVILAGKFDQGLTDVCPLAEDMKAALNLSFNKVYRSEGVLLREVAGYEAIEGILDAWGSMVIHWEKARRDVSKLSGKDRNLYNLFRDKLKGTDSPYQSMLRVTDYVSGMTDRFAIETYKKLKGSSV